VLTTPKRRAGVQSIDRVFALLEAIADAGGEAGLTELSRQTGLQGPTIHRLLQTIAQSGYVRREANRRYLLGPRLIRLGEVAQQPISRWARPYLAGLVAATGETANLAMLDGDMIMYVAQAPSSHSMRMFTDVGRRVRPHATGVGKAILADLPREHVLKMLNRIGLPARTPRTITDLDQFLSELDGIGARGYAIENGELELAVRCIAVAVPQITSPRYAVSISGPDSRITDDMIPTAVTALHRVAVELSGEIEPPVAPATKAQPRNKNRLTTPDP
jgi:IclR family transcriptional regulator, acetate operon repressor